MFICVIYVYMYIFCKYRLSVCIEILLICLASFRTSLFSIKFVSADLALLHAVLLDYFAQVAA
jgi:hypothetical protein